MATDTNIRPVSAMRAHDNLVKNIEHLLGMCRGLVADNKLNSDEIIFLDAWLKDTPDLYDTWPGSTIAKRLKRILIDDEITADEAQDLKQCLLDIIGRELDDGAVSGGATAFPVDDIAEMDANGKRFCCTGKFLFGSRNACIRAIKERGGTHTTGVSGKTDYLIIGALSSRDWKMTSYGRKIEDAINMKARGHAIAIVAEPKWAELLQI